MQKELKIYNLIGWFFGLLIFTIGVLNLVLVHPVPGIAFLLLSAIFFPPANQVFRKWFGFTIPVPVKIILGIFLLWFTLGVSDLGDIIDDWMLE